MQIKQQKDEPRSLEKEFKNVLVETKINNKEEILALLFQIRSFQTMLSYNDNFYVEITQLLFNSIQLYEKGYFDVAWLSIRNSYETCITMLDIEKNDKINKWMKGGYFSLNTSLKRLKKNEEFQDYYDKFKEYFEFYEDCFKNWNMNKIIHKQGYETYYEFNNVPYLKDKRNDYNFEYALDKMMSLAVLSHIYRNPLTHLLNDDEIYCRAQDNEKIFVRIIDVEYWGSKIKINDLKEKLDSTILIKNMRKEYLKKEIMDKDIFKFIHERYINFDSINKIPTNNLTNTQEISLTLLKNNIIFHEFFPLIITDTLLILVFEKRIANTDKEHLIAILPGFSSKIFDDLFKTYKENNGQKINLIFGNFHISFLKYKNEEYLFTHKEILDKESVKFLLNNFLR